MTAMTQKPQSLTFNRFRTLVTDHGSRPTDGFFLSHDLSVAMSVEHIILRAIWAGSLFQLVDYRLGIIRAGHARVRINLIEHDLRAGQVAFVTPGSIAQPLSISPDFCLEGMALSADLLRLVTENRLPAFLNGRWLDARLPAAETDIRLIDGMLGMLLRTLDSRSGCQPLVHAQIKAILCLYDELFAQAGEQPEHRRGNAQSIFDRFIYLVNNNHREHHQLGFYADKMCLSERYLGTVVRQASGATAKEWIDRALITSAKVMLKHTTRSAAQIADDLHFANPSFFSKYFLRLTGCTPQAYRRM